MRTKKRRKSSRYHGSQTAKRGAKERTRSSGNRGGYGMAGTGKRGDQKKTLVIKLFGNDYFGKDRTLRRGRPSKKLHSINIGDIQTRIHSFIAQKKAKESKGSYELDLTGYKILGSGDLSIKVHITASAASASAHEKIKAAGGSVKLLDKEQDKEEKKTAQSDKK